MNTKDIIALAGRLDIMAVRRKHHEAITWEYGNTILTAVEEQAETIAKALRAYAADAVATSAPLNAPLRSAERMALEIAVKDLKWRFSAQVTLEQIEALVPGIVK